MEHVSAIILSYFTMMQDLCIGVGQLHYRVLQEKQIRNLERKVVISFWSLYPALGIMTEPADSNFPSHQPHPATRSQPWSQIRTIYGCSTVLIR
jgi:hypothetical protein